MWVGHVAIALTGRHHIYQTLRQLLFVVTGFYSNPTCTAKLSQLIFSVDSLDTRNTMLLDEEVQVVVANLLSSTSILHNVSKLHMFITLGCNLFALQDTFPVFSSFLKVVCSTEIPQKSTCCLFDVPPDNIIQQLIHQDLQNMYGYKIFTI